MTAVHTGVAAGVLAVAAGALFEVQPPDAYGICMACHGRDLVNWIANRTLGVQLMVAPASMVFPLLTTVGALAGAFVAARRHREWRWWTPDHPGKAFVYGLLVMNFALLAGGCSIRLLLRAGAGEALGLVGFGTMAAGVVLATMWLRWRASR